MSPGEPLGIICIASRCVRRRARNPQSDDLTGLSRANDTDDTKPSSRDTSTIQAVPTMTLAGVFYVDFAAKTLVSERVSQEV
jgi:hypothetical protein